MPLTRLTSARCTDGTGNPTAAQRLVKTLDNTVACTAGADPQKGREPETAPPDTSERYMTHTVVILQACSEAASCAVPCAATCPARVRHVLP